jgi:hypothetical protein
VGSSITIKSNPILKLVWEKDGKEIYNSSNLDPSKIENVLIPQIPGVYTAEINTVYGVYTTNSIEILDNPKNPTISTESDLVLVSSEKWGNQWYIENSILTGDTLQKYKALKSGNYKVKYKNSLGCISDFSKEKNLLILGTEKESNGLLVTFPNPFENKIILEFKEIKNINYELFLFDLFGKIVLNKKSVRNGDSIDMSFLPSGNYVLMLKNELNNSIEAKLTKY